MKRVLAFLAFIPILTAGVIPGRYIVVLSTEPVAEHMVRQGARGPNARAALRSSEAQTHRARLRAEQQNVRARVEQQSGQVIRQLDTVTNALIVHIPDAQAAQLATIPGVKKVYPVQPVGEGRTVLYKLKAQS